MAKIGLDYGHGSNTFPPSKGVYKDGIPFHEHSFNATLGLKIKRLLEASGHTVIEAQPAFKPEVSLLSRTRLYNRRAVDIVVSIHANANSNDHVDGICAFYWHSSVAGKRLAQGVINEIKAKGYETHGNGLHASKRGSWTNLHMVRETRMPSILVENGFMTNDEPGKDDDFERIFGSEQEEYTDNLAEAYVKAINNYFGVKSEVKTPSHSVASSTSKAPTSEDYKGNSVVDYLNHIGEDSSYDNRKRLAEKFGISGYKGTASQNIDLLNKLRGKGGAAKPKPKPSPSPKVSASKASLKVDGKWGESTNKALQRALGTPVDGVISNQSRNSVTQALYGGVTFGSGGSPMVKALQRKVGAKADGLLGPNTVRSLQRYLGTVQDGVLSRPSLVVEEMQRRLNAGTF